jgi:hypothetical protein
MKLVTISTLFEVKYGVNLELNRLVSDPNGINFVSRAFIYYLRSSDIAKMGLH